MVYNKEPIDVLWSIMKDLRKQIPIYKETMHEDKNSIPQSYIQLRSQVTDTPFKFGDGNTLIRSADCDIILISKGFADDTTDLHNINKKKIREHLKNKGITFSEYNLGYNDILKSTEHTFSIGVDYIG